jgi:hypothetical protein
MSNRFTKLLTAAVLIGAPASALASPRTLASGAPACGNTMGKGGYDDGCTTAERAASHAERVREQAREERAERTRRVAARRQAAQAKAKTEQARQRMAIEIALLTRDPLHRPRS